MNKNLIIVLIAILMSSCTNNQPHDLCAGLRVVKINKDDILTKETKRDIFINKKLILDYCYETN